MAHDFAAALQVVPTFDRSATTFDDAVTLIGEGEADIAICKLSRTLKRGRVIRFSRPYSVLHHGLITKRVRFAPHGKWQIDRPRRA